MKTCEVVFISFVLLKCVCALNSNLLGNTQGAQVFRIVPKDENEMKFLKNAFKKDIADFWSHPRIIGRPVHIMTLDWMTSVFINMLNSEKIEYEIIIDDVKSYIDEFNEKNEVALAESRKNGLKMSWSAYHPYDDIVQWMDETAGQFPSLASVRSLGKTFENRDTKILKLSLNDERKPTVLIDAGMHGREWLGPATATFLINELLTNSKINLEVKELLQYLDIYVVPVANPDGYVYTWDKARLWSKNRYDAKLKTSCIGVDISRNWDFHWNEVENMTNVCSDHNPGKSPFSEIETRNLRDEFLRLFPDVKFYLSLHSFGQNWFSPWSYTKEPTHDDDEISSLVKNIISTMGEVSGTQYTSGQRLKESFYSSGTSIDWAKGVGGVKYAFQIELPDVGEFGFFLPPERIESVGKEVLAGLRYILNFTRNEYRQTQGKDEL